MDKTTKIPQSRIADAMPEDYEFTFEAASDGEAITRAAEILAALYGTLPEIVD